MITSHLLDVRNLKMHFPYHGGARDGSRVVKAVDDVSLWIDEGETLGLVGESGCGKSTLARAIARLYRPTSGQILFRGQDLATLEGEALRQARRQIQMVFQDPYSSLNPRMTVEKIVSEPLRNFGETQDLSAHIQDLLLTVGLDSTSLHRYAHQFSGGQRQRIAIARALGCNPEFLVLDEPTSALDVSVQAQILTLLSRLKEQMDLTYLYVTHDLSVAEVVCQRIGVMYLGKIVEISPAAALFRSPAHPYSIALIAAVPIPDPTQKRSRVRLPGEVPSPSNPPPGCRFHPRCQYATGECHSQEPPLEAIGPGHYVACWHPQLTAQS